MTRRFSRIFARATLLGVAGLLLFTLFGSSNAQAQSAPGWQWEQTSLTGPVKKLYTPASGALFARTVDGLTRSDDGGASWTPVSLPAAASVPGMPAGWTRSIVVDPNTHTTIYAATAEGVYKTEDDAVSWRLVLPVDPEVPKYMALAVSQADTQLVYVALANERLNRFRLVRSLDGGQTWESAVQREQSQHVACEWGVALLQPHATDPNRVYLAASCSRNAVQADLEQSNDRGQTWTDLYTPRLAEPDWLVAGDASSMLLALRKDSRGGGSILAQSRDDGATWTTILEYSGGGGMSGGGPDVSVGGLAADPTAPNRLLLGFNARQSPTDLPSRIQLSDDGGATWTEIAPPDLPRLHDVRFGVDGQMLFVATESGVWRASPSGQ